MGVCAPVADDACAAGSPGVMGMRVRGGTGVCPGGNTPLKVSTPDANSTTATTHTDQLCLTGRQCRADCIETL